MRDHVVRIKKTVEHHTPEIIAATALIGLVAITYFTKKTPPVFKATKRMHLEIPFSAAKELLESGESYFISSPTEDLILRITVIDE